MQKETKSFTGRRYAKIITTGKDLAKLCESLHITHMQFAYCVGISRFTMTELLAGKFDGRIPFQIDLAIRLSHYDKSVWTAAPDGKVYRDYTRRKR